jgi:hypothetical protein
MLPVFIMYLLLIMLPVFIMYLLLIILPVFITYQLLIMLLVFILSLGFPMFDDEFPTRPRPVIRTNAV